jgi:hypothetical protein
MLDEQGRNPKKRAGVIVTAIDQISDDRPFVVVAVTSTFSEPLLGTQVKLPWNQDRRKVRTGLTKPVVAKCDWLCAIRKEDVESYGGVVPPAVLLEIIKRLPSTPPGEAPVKPP